MIWSIITHLIAAIIGGSIGAFAVSMIQATSGTFKNHSDDENK